MEIITDNLGIIAIIFLILTIVFAIIYFAIENSTFKLMGLIAAIICLLISIGFGGYWFYNNRKDEKKLKKLYNDND